MSDGQHTQDDDDDDVQFLYEQQASLPCQICELNLAKMTPKERTEHYDEHFSESSEAGPSSPKHTGFRLPFTNKRKRADSEAEDVFWYSAQTSPPPRNFTPGLIPLLKKALIKSHSKGSTEKAYLSSDVAVHVNSEGWDRGWGCGYRNFLMVCAALMGQQQQPMYFPLLDSPTPPGVRRLQAWLEDAWSQGFDEEGAQQLKHHLKGTGKWIGTGELYVAFVYRGIPAQLIDFDLKNQGIGPLIHWVVDYFTPVGPKQTTINEALQGASPVVITDKPPVVLQHAGHSRTIVGYERSKNGNISLFIFDPARRVPDDMRRAAMENLHFDPKPESTPKKYHLSPKKVINKVLHPHRNDTDAKRPRTTPDNVIIIDDDDDNEPSTTSAPAAKVELADVLKMFRVNSNALGRRAKYQILYFPMTAPLTEQERLQRRIVTSKKI